MKKCPKCGSPMIFQKLFQNAYAVCRACYTLTFTESTFRWLATDEFIKRFDLQVSKGRIVQKPCSQCAQSLSILPMAETLSHPENLQIYSQWKTWNKSHLQGAAEIEYCKRCGTVSVNSRSFCLLPIDWQAHKEEFSEYESKEAAIQGGTEYPMDPLKFVGAFVFGVPYVENLPSLSELPIITYITVIAAAVVTNRSMINPDLVRTLAFDPSHKGENYYQSLLSYPWVHASWGSFWGNFLMLIIFAPLTEHELRPEKFIAMLVSAAIVTAWVHQVSSTEPLIGFGGIVLAVMVFFSFRFPSAIIGFKKSRYAGPLAILIYFVTSDLIRPETNFGMGNTVGPAQLAGAFVGFLFHALTPKGPSTELFKKMNLERMSKAKAIKNWRE